MNPIVAQVVAFIIGFLRDEAGNNSSSRLIAVGSANVMAIYITADIVARYAGRTPMNENVMLACVGTLGLLGGVAYGVNKAADVKRAKIDKEAESL